MGNLVIKYFKIGILLVTAHLPRINLKTSPVKITRHNAKPLRSVFILCQQEVKQNEYRSMGFGHCLWGDRDFFSLRRKQEKVGKRRELLFLDTIIGSDTK